MSSTSSITDVAPLARVSKATVSRILSGRRTKDDNIAKRVRDAAEQLNYQANSAASALRSDTTNTIGLIMPGPTDPLAARLLAELEPEVNRSGRQLLLGLGDDQRTQAERIEAMLARRVDGLVVMPPQDANTAAFLDDYVGMTSLVQAFGHSTSFHVNWVGVDESASMKLMLSHLAEYNADSIAFLSGNVNSASAAELFATLQTSTRVMNLMTEPGWTTFGDNSAKRGYHDVMRLFGDKGNRPNALICATDDVAIGALMALNQLGIRVPDEVKVIGSGDSPAAAIADPPLSSILPPCRLIAHEALRLISVSASSKHWLPAHTAYPPQLVQRESTSGPRFGSSDMALPDDES